MLMTSQNLVWWFRPNQASNNSSGSLLFSQWIGFTPPPLFTAATETVADLANQALLDYAPIGPRRLDMVNESDYPVPALAPSPSIVFLTVPLPVKPVPCGRP
jgi:hypothetical protein